MSRYDYLMSRKLEGENYSFDTLIMGAMRKADDVNIEILKNAYPELYKELKARYNAGGGYLEGEIPEVD